MLEIFFGRVYSQDTRPNVFQAFSCLDLVYQLVFCRTIADRLKCNRVKDKNLDGYSALYLERTFFPAQKVAALGESCNSRFKMISGCLACIQK